MNVIEFFQKDEFARSNGIEIVEVRPGYAKVRVLLTPHHMNAGGGCQGGVLFTLADLAFAAATNSSGILTVTTSANITFLHGVSKGWIYAEATMVDDHRKLPLVEARITDESGRTIAYFTASGYRKEGVVLPIDTPDNTTE